MGRVRHKSLIIRGHGDRGNIRTIFTSFVSSHCKKSGIWQKFHRNMFAGAVVYPVLCFFSLELCPFAKR